MILLNKWIFIENKVKTCNAAVEHSVKLVMSR